MSRHRAVRDSSDRAAKPLGHPWPAADRRTVAAVKWQVWIGYQLRTWRRSVNRGRGIPQQTAAPKAGMSAGALSEIEWGRRRVDAVELLALTHAYKRTTDDIAALFTAPTEDQWQLVRSRYALDSRFHDPP
jgi:hypothetical protein